MTCYLASLVFSTSFEDFDRVLVIEDASTDNQCRNAQELLGYDRDYACDTEVEDKFKEFMCSGIEITAADHMGEGVLAPPEFTKVEF